MREKITEKRIKHNKNKKKKIKSKTKRNSSKTLADTLEWPLKAQSTLAWKSISAGNERWGVGYKNSV